MIGYPVGEDGAILPTWDYPTCMFNEKNFFESQIINPLLTNLFCKFSRESSFNMTRGDEDIERVVGLQKFLDTRKGGSEKIRGGSENLYTSKTKRRGGS